MNLTKLLTAVGKDVRVQWLPCCMTRIEHRKGLAHVTFTTTELSAAEVMAQAMDGKMFNKVGLVVWLPYDKLPASVKSKLTPFGMKDV